MRLAILGNSGSGKSTLAQWASTASGAALLDLDTVAWDPGQVAVPRDPRAARADVDSHCTTNASWVIEGCYATLIEVALRHRPYLVFLNPGEARCLANCRARPWEPHKYASREEQDERLAFLLEWVSGYYTRDGELSLAGHRACYDAYAGPKLELTSLPQLG